MTPKCGSHSSGHCVARVMLSPPQSVAKDTAAITHEWWVPFISVSFQCILKPCLLILFHTSTMGVLQKKQSNCLKLLNCLAVWTRFARATQADGSLSVHGTKHGRALCIKLLQCGKIAVSTSLKIRAKCVTFSCSAARSTNDDFFKFVNLFPGAV